MMKLFGAPVSPFVRKVLAYVAERGLDVEMVPIGLGDPNEEFRAASPLGKMPAFSDGAFSISDSTAIITYLEAKLPDGALIPAGPEDRARTVWFDEFADTVLAASAGKVFFNRIVSPRFVGKPGDDAAAQQGEAELGPLFDYLEGALRPSGHLVGDSLTLADIAVASPLVNAAHCGITVDAARHPKLAAFTAAMHARPSFADWIRRERKMLGLG